MKLSKSAQTALLPQYLPSEDVMARFLDALHDIADPEISRTEYLSGTRLVRPSEIELDAMDFFIASQPAFEREFQTRLAEAVGSVKTDAFCRILREDWFDGRAKRNSAAVDSLRASVEGYLAATLSRPSQLDVTRALFTAEECAKLLTINYSMLWVAVDDWLAQHRRGDQISSGDVFLRRGLVLQEAFRNPRAYTERDVISSYSFSVTIAEQFCNSMQQALPALVNADFHYFKDRILFFSPFIPGMDGRQLEVGIIPGDGPDRMAFVGEHRGISEYLLGFPPELLD